MKELNISIPLVIPSQKNLKRVAYNRRTGKPFILSDDRVHEWRKRASVYLPKDSFKGKVSIDFEFTHKDKRRKDLDNEISSLLDLLVLSKIIEDDSCKVVTEIHAKLVGFDKDKPCVNIIIDSLEN